MSIWVLKYMIVSDFIRVNKINMCRTAGNCDIVEIREIK